MTFRTNGLRPHFRGLGIFCLGRSLRVRRRGSIGGRHFASLGLHDLAGLNVCYWDSLGPHVLFGRPDPLWLGLKNI